MVHAKRRLRNDSNEAGYVLMFGLITMGVVLLLMGITVQLSVGVRDSNRNVFRAMQSLVLASHNFPWQQASLDGATWGMLLNGVAQSDIKSRERRQKLSRFGGFVEFDYVARGETLPSGQPNTGADSMYVTVTKKLPFLDRAFHFFSGAGLHALSTSIRLGATMQNVMLYTALDRSMSFAGPRVWQGTNHGDYTELFQTLFDKAIGASVTVPYTGGVVTATVQNPPVLPESGPSFGLNDEYRKICFPLNIGEPDPIYFGTSTDGTQFFPSNRQAEYVAWHKACNQIRRIFPFFITGDRAGPPIVYNSALGRNEPYYVAQPMTSGAMYPYTITPLAITTLYNTANASYLNHNNPGDSVPLGCGWSRERLLDAPPVIAAFNRPGARFNTAKVVRRGAYISADYDVSDKNLCIEPWDVEGRWATWSGLFNGTHIISSTNQPGERNLCDNNPANSEQSVGCSSQTAALWFSSTDMKLATDSNTEDFLIATSNMASQAVLSIFSGATANGGPLLDSATVPNKITGNTILFNGVSETINGFPNPEKDKNMYNTPVRRVQDILSVSYTESQSGSTSVTKSLSRNIFPVFAPHRIQKMLLHLDQVEYDTITKPFRDNLSLPPALLRVAELYKVKSHPSPGFPIFPDGMAISYGLDGSGFSPAEWQTGYSFRGYGDAGRTSPPDNVGLAMPAPRLMNQWPYSTNPMNSYYNNLYDFPALKEIDASGNQPPGAGLYQNSTISTYAPAFIKGTAVASGGTDTLAVLRSMKELSEAHRLRFDAVGEQASRLNVLITDGGPNIEFCVQSSLPTGLTCANQPNRAAHLSVGGEIDTALHDLKNVPGTRLIVILVNHGSQNDPDEIDRVARFKNLFTNDPTLGTVLEITYNNNQEFSQKFRAALLTAAAILRSQVRFINY